MTAAPTAPTPQDGPDAVVRRLRAQLAATPRAARPVAHATLRYRLGMALAELPATDRAGNLERAVAQYDRAAELFRPGAHPREHARVLTARAAALRELGRAAQAITSCERALSALASLPAAQGDRGAALNNLALARSDAGDHEGAITAAAESVEALAEAGIADAAAADQVGGLHAMAQHNHGQVLAAAGRHDQAIEVYRAAAEAVDAEQLPFQWALLQHALGISLSARDDPAGAIGAFDAALRVLTRARHPLQHAMASHNQALAWAAVGDVTGLRRAAVRLSDALSVLDPRLHAELWQQARDAFDVVEDRLAEAGEAGDHVSYLVDLLAVVEEDERTDLARGRLTRVLALPQPHRRDRLAEIMAVAVTREEAAGITALTALLSVLLELPDAQLREGLAAVMAGLEVLPEGDEHDDAAWIVERAISEGALAPQRLRMRDHLTELGYERP